MTQDLSPKRLIGRTALSHSYKRTFPFRIATTSYIYPDYILPNVELLAPYLDEIELILFESDPEDGLPTRDEIMNLAEIGQKQDISYNVHLPIDIFLGDPDPEVRRYGIEIIKEIIVLTSPIHPTSYTLHLESKAHDGQRCMDISRWKRDTLESVKRVLETGIPSRQISIETLDYPFDKIEGVIEELDLSICLDLGHLLLYGYSIEDYAARYLDRTKVIHLHGVKKGLAHISLDVMHRDQINAILSIFHDFSETLCLEVFSFSELRSSIECLERHWKRYHE